MRHDILVAMVAAKSIKLMVSKSFWVTTSQGLLWKLGQDKFGN